MRVDGPNRLDQQPLPEAQMPVRKPTPGEPAAGPQGQDGLSVEGSCAAYVRKAMDGGEINADAVAEARRLLQSGQLDSPQAALRAAEAMLEHGI